MRWSSGQGTAHESQPPLSKRNRVTRCDWDDAEQRGCHVDKFGPVLGRLGWIDSAVT